MPDRPLLRLALPTALFGARCLGHPPAGLLLRTGGVVGAHWFGAPVLILETTGRRHRQTPLIFAQSNGEVVVLAPAARRAGPPGWLRELQASGRGVLHVGAYSWAVAPRVLDGPERTDAWGVLATVHPKIQRSCDAMAHGLSVIALRDLAEDWPVADPRPSEAATAQGDDTTVTRRPRSPMDSTRSTRSRQLARIPRAVSRTRRVGRPTCG